MWKTYCGKLNNTQYILSTDTLQRQIFQEKLTFINQISSIALLLLLLKEVILKYSISLQFELNSKCFTESLGMAFLQQLFYLVFF